VRSPLPCCLKSEGTPLLCASFLGIALFIGLCKRRMLPWESHCKRALLLDLPAREISPCPVLRTHRARRSCARSALCGTQGGCCSWISLQVRSPLPCALQSTVDDTAMFVPPPPPLPSASAGCCLGNLAASELNLAASETSSRFSLQVRCLPCLVFCNRRDRHCCVRPALREIAPCPVLCKRRMVSWESYCK
jgi:hypothetical protein